MSVKLPFNIGWFSTGKDEQARALLQKTFRAATEKKIGNANINYVFLNREKGEDPESDRFIRLTERLGIPVICFSSQKFKPELRKEGIEKANQGHPETIDKWRRLYDEQIIDRIQKYKVDTVFLAGYMLILTGILCKNFFILNLHPALPGGPKGTWQEVIWEIIRRKKNKAGIMIHKVTAQLDAGPAVAYCEFPLRGGKFTLLWEKWEKKMRRKTFDEAKQQGEKEPLFTAIREEQVKREIPLVLRTLHLLAEDKINKTNITEPVLVKI